MTYFLNKPMDLDPGPASGLTGGIRTRAEGFWARWQMSSLRSNLMWEDENAREGAEHQLAEQLRPRLTEQPSEWAYGFIRRAPADMDRQVIAAARRDAETNPDAWSDIDLSDEGIEAEALRRRRATLEALQMDAALAPQPSFLGELLTQMAAETLSPRALPALVVGGGAGGSLLRVAAREAAINVGVTAALLPEQFEASEALGLPRPDIAGELGEAALFGAVFGVGFEALGRGLRYGRELAAPRVEGRTALEAELETERAVAALQRGPEALAALRDAQPIIINPQRLAVPEWASEARALDHLQPVATGAQLRSSTAVTPTSPAPSPIPLRQLLEDRQMFDRARTAVPEVFAEMETLAQRQESIRQNIAALENGVEGVSPDAPVRLSDTVDDPPRTARSERAVKTEVITTSSRENSDLTPDLVPEVITPRLPALRRELDETQARMETLRPQITEAYRAARPPQTPAPEGMTGAPDAGHAMAEVFDDVTSPQAENLRAAMANEMRDKIEKRGDFQVLDEDGQMRDASSVLDELDREDAFLARIDLCGMGP